MSDTDIGSKPTQTTTRRIYEGGVSLNEASLLDFFAAEALPTVLAEHVKANKGSVKPLSVGMVCYAVALGMLAAREQPEEAFAPQETKIEPPPEPDRG